MPLSLVITEGNIRDKDWDDFASRCGASFRCARRALAAWQFDHHIIHRIRLLQIHREEAGGSRKIAQCAVGIGRKRRVFADSLQILPEYKDLWPEVMRAVLAHLGPGTYHYGSQWNLEAPREEILARLPGVTVRHVEAITLDVVDFRQWPSWEAYFRQISNNAKRNARKARDNYADLSLVMSSGLRSFREWRSLYELKTMLAHRKSISLSKAKSALRFFMRLYALGTRNFTALVQAGGENMAAFSGIDFGANTYFLEAGSRDANNGTSWHLLLGMMARAFERSPTGCFVMGAQYESEPRDEGLAFSRRQVRVQRLPTSEVIFSYVAVRQLTLVPPAPRPAPALEPLEELVAAARVGLDPGRQMPA